MSSTTRKLAATFAEKFTTEIAPAFAAWAQRLAAEDWSKLDDKAILERFHTATQRTLVEFARDSLKPTVLADLSWQTLLNMLQSKLDEETARKVVAQVAFGARPPAEADLSAGVRAFAAGELDRTTFLARFGHRCHNEMELAQPRWSEDPAAVDRLARQQPGRERSPSLRRIEAEIAALAKPGTPDEVWKQIADEAKLAGPLRDTARTWAIRLRTYLGLREAAKHYLLLGHAIIRRALLELDKRSCLQGGIFYILPDELPELLAGQDVTDRIAGRRRRRRLELSLEVPAVLFSDDLEAIGRPAPVPVGATLLEGTPLSVGTAEGAALVLAEPTADLPDEPYVLVCPSTDPAWVPLFTDARALVMETGGVLSHGAIVAREFGLPAVAGLPGIVRQLRTGQRLRVDGGRGTVAILT
jgi:pyruvate,water dikinase